MGNLFCYGSGFEPATATVKLALGRGSAKRVKQKKAQSIFFCERAEERNEVKRYPAPKIKLIYSLPP